MSIIDTKEGALGPLLALIVLRFRLHNIEDNCYPIFIIVSYNTLISIGTIASHKAIPLVGEFSVLIVRQRLKLVGLTQSNLVPDLLEV